MTKPIHRHKDQRKCGATTVVSGQKTVFANGLLVSVDDDPNSHGSGALNAKCKKVYVNGKMVVIVGNSAAPDSLCPPLGGAHCAPASSSGSGNVFVGE
jgi:uncharacterized Zn-binding protein involved in type VI secretion